MARDWATTYSTNVVANTHTIPFTSPAVAGRKVVGIAVAPAGITFPAGWTEQVTSSNKGELTVGVLPAVGEETQLVLTLTPSGATRCLLGWVESRDDLGPLDGTPVQAATTTISATSLTVGTITTTAANSRIYAAIVQVGSTGATFNAWSPTFPGYLTADPVLASTGGGNEPVRMVVASGVAATPGAYTITVTGLASLPSGHAYQGIAFAFAPPAPPAPAAETLIESENRLTGTAKSVWDVTGAGDPSIQGFATAMSVVQGGTLSVKVHSPSSAWTGKVYRLGWYGGNGAREVGTISGAQTTQPSGTTDATTGMVSCGNWTANGSWAVPADATPGEYLIKVFRNDNNALASHVGPFVVRNPSRKAPILVTTSDTTWQAYNHAGANPADPFAGANLYGTGTATGFTFNTGARCKAISYDRPLVTRQFLPQTSFFNAEYPLVRWLERLGYDVDYATKLDVDGDASLLLGRDIVVSSGHDEYWPPRVRDAFVAARDAGVHLVFLSGNEAFWRINPVSPGGREYACWKDSLNGSLNASGVYSGTWQDTRNFNPDRRPAALLNGQRFRLNGQSAYPMAVPAELAASPLWRSTAVAQLATGQTWTSPTGIVGFEADEPADMNPAEKPAGLIRLSQVTHQITGMLSDDNGAVYTGSGPFTHAMTAYRSATTGAVVFAAGTVQFAWGLDDVHDRYPGSSTVTPVLQQALTNLLADLGQVPPAYPFPAGLVRPTPVALSTYGLPDPSTEPPPEPATPPVTLAQLKKQLNRTDSRDDEELQLYLDAAIEAVETIIGGPIQVTTITETQTASRRGVIMPFKRPLVSVTSLSYGGAIVDPGNYDVDLTVGAVSLGYVGASAYRLGDAYTLGNPYTLVYEAGLTTLPASYKLAILIIAQHLWRTQHGGGRARPGDDPVTVPGMSFAIPSRAAELLRGGTLPGIA